MTSQRQPACHRIKNFAQVGACHCAALAATERAIEGVELLQFDADLLLCRIELSRLSSGDPLHSIVGSALTGVLMGRFLPDARQCPLMAGGLLLRCCTPKLPFASAPVAPIAPARRRQLMLTQSSRLRFSDEQWAKLCTSPAPCR